MSRCAVYKSQAAEFVDDFFDGQSQPLADAYDRAEQLLAANTTSLLGTTSALVSNGELANGTDADFDNFWLQDPKLSSLQVDRIMRAGYEEALRLGRDQGLVPIETFWVTGASDDFEMHVVKSRRRVTVFVLIPKTRRYGSTRAAAQSFVVRLGGLRDEALTLDNGTNVPVVKVQVSGEQVSGN
jgi:hypothetical protein